MAANYDIIDLTYTWNGDYKIGHDGDLEDTSEDQIQSLIQEICDIVRSSIGDWEEHPNRAASLDDFIGEPNNRDTADAISARIKTALISNDLVRANDVSVRVIPVGIHQVMIVVSVSVLATQNNSIIAGGQAIVSLLFDSIEKSVHFLDAVRPE